MADYSYKRGSVVGLYVFVCVCLLVTIACDAKMAKQIKMPFRGLTRVIPVNNVLDGGQGRTSLLAAAYGDKTAMRPFIKIL